MLAFASTVQENKLENFLQSENFLQKGRQAYNVARDSYSYHYNSIYFLSMAGKVQGRTMS